MEVVEALLAESLILIEVQVLWEAFEGLLLMCFVGGRESMLSSEESVEMHLVSRLGVRLGRTS